MLYSFIYGDLSYDVTFIQRITSCHKNGMTTRVITLARRRNAIDNFRVNNAFLIQIMIILRAIKFHFKGSYEKQNLKSWSFHMKFMKRAFGDFINRV